jgi:hypothetical protein
MVTFEWSEHAHCALALFVSGEMGTAPGTQDSAVAAVERAPPGTHDSVSTWLDWPSISRRWALRSAAAAVKARNKRALSVERIGLALSPWVGRRRVVTRAATVSPSIPRAPCTVRLGAWLSDS